MKRLTLAALAALGVTLAAPNFNTPAAAGGELELVAQADERPAEPTPTWMIVDAGPETGAAAEVAGPAEASSSSPATPSSADTAPTIDPEQDPAGYLRQLYDAVRSGKGALIAAMLLIGLVYVARRWGGKRVPWLASDRGGVVLAGAGALLGGIVNAILAGTTIDAETAIAVLEVALLAMGGWTGVRRLLWPPDKAAATS